MGGWSSPTYGSLGAAVLPGKRRGRVLDQRCQGGGHEGYVSRGGEGSTGLGAAGRGITSLIFTGMQATCAERLFVPLFLPAASPQDDPRPLLVGDFCTV